MDQGFLCTVRKNDYYYCVPMNVFEPICMSNYLQTFLALLQLRRAVAVMSSGVRPFYRMTVLPSVCSPDFLKV